MSESQSLSSSALLSLSVGSIISAVLTGQDTVGAWKPAVKLKNWINLVISIQKSSFNIAS